MTNSMFDRGKNSCSLSQDFLLLYAGTALHFSQEIASYSALLPASSFSRLTPAAVPLDSCTLFPDPSLLLVQSGAEIRNRRPVTPSEKEYLFFLPYCPDWLHGFKRLNGQCWSSGASYYLKWEGLSQNFQGLDQA